MLLAKSSLPHFFMARGYFFIFSVSVSDSKSVSFHLPLVLEDRLGSRLFARCFFFLQLAPATQLCKHTHKRTARMHTHMCKLQKLRSTGKSSTICPSMRVLYLRPCVRVCVCVWRSAIVCCETAACRAHFNIFFSRINYCACSCDWKIKKKPFSSDDF